MPNLSLHPKSFQEYDLIDAPEVKGRNYTWKNIRIDGVEIVIYRPTEIILIHREGTP